MSWAFAEAANFSIRYCKEAKKFYQKKCAKTNQPSAYRALANKIAKACYFIMKEKKAFDVERLFYWEDVGLRGWSREGVGEKPQDLIGGRVNP